MLILTREPGEVIVINDNIRIMICGVKGSNVRLGIEAPKDIGVDREEIWQRKQADKLHQPIVPLVA